MSTKAAAAQVRSPTLIIHVRGDQLNSLASNKKVADLIPGARLVIIEDADNIPMPGTGESEEIAQLVVLPHEDLPAKGGVPDSRTLNREPIDRVGEAKTSAKKLVRAHPRMMIT